jgi:hypothetical protein
MERSHKTSMIRIRAGTCLGRIVVEAAPVSIIQGFEIDGRASF